MKIQNSDLRLQLDSCHIAKCATGCPLFIFMQRYTDKPVLHGYKEIGDFLGKSRTTIYRWVKRYNLPVMKAPDGKMITFKSLLENWVMATIEVQREKKL